MLDALAATIREHGTAGRAIRPVGGGTKLAWGGGGPAGAIDLETGGLDEIHEHNVGDFTAVLGAGVRLGDAQAKFREEGAQMFALDPPLGADDGATVGGIVATADSGPLRHRYGGVRDLIVGITVVLSDGTVAKAGGKVIKNVAGYDLAKLFTGSYGTLGLIASVSMRLHPLPSGTATMRARFGDPAAALPVVETLAALPLEADCFDVVWRDGAGEILVRFGGAAAAEQAASAAERAALDTEVLEDDEAAWAGIRALQRSADGVVVKVSGRPSDLTAVLRTASEHGGTAVSRAVLGLAWLALPAGADVAAVRDALSPRACTVLDGADRVGDAWPAPTDGALAVMARVKERFDPARVFRPGVFVGGI